MSKEEGERAKRAFQLSLAARIAEQEGESALAKRIDALAERVFTGEVPSFGPRIRKDGKIDGRFKGGNTKHSQETRDQVMELHREGRTGVSISQIMGIPQRTVANIIVRERQKQQLNNQPAQQD